MMWSLPLLRTARLGLNAILTLPEPRAVALAVAMGTAVGLVPKGNLLAAALGVAMCAVRLNLVVALGVAVGVSLVSVFIDPLFDAVGYAVLTWKPLGALWTWVAHLPLASWSQFNDTVVMGAFLLAVAQVYPTYWVTKRLADRFLPPLTQRLGRTRLLQAWRRMEWGTRIAHVADA